MDPYVSLRTSCEVAPGEQSCCGFGPGLPPGAHRARWSIPSDGSEHVFRGFRSWGAGSHRLKIRNNQSPFVPDEDGCERTIEQRFEFRRFERHGRAFPGAGLAKRLPRGRGCVAMLAARVSAGFERTNKGGMGWASRVLVSSEPRLDPHRSRSLGHDDTSCTFPLVALASPIPLLLVPSSAGALGQARARPYVSTWIFRDVMLPPGSSLEGGQGGAQGRAPRQPVHPILRWGRGRTVPGHTFVLQVDGTGLPTLGCPAISTEGFPPSPRHRWLQHEHLLGTDEPGRPEATWTPEGTHFPSASHRRIGGRFPRFSPRGIGSLGDSDPLSWRPFASPRFKTSNRPSYRVPRKDPCRSDPLSPRPDEEPPSPSACPRRRLVVPRRGFPGGSFWDANGLLRPQWTVSSESSAIPNESRRKTHARSRPPRRQEGTVRDPNASEENEGVHADRWNGVPGRPRNPGRGEDGSGHASDASCGRMERSRRETARANMADEGIDDAKSARQESRPQAAIL